MKTFQVPYCFYPDPVGGTEVYTAALARSLKSAGVEVIVVAPGEGDASYLHDGIQVRRFAISKALTLRELYGDGDFNAAERFCALLDREQPDVVHLHALSPAVSQRLVADAKRRGIGVVFTYHTPTVSCMRGTLLYWGKEVCDGALRRERCARCALHGRGLNRLASAILASFPPHLGRLVGRAGLSGPVWTALRMTELAELRHGSLRAFLSEVDRVVALCRWTRDLLVLSGVPPSKIALSPHGVTQSNEVVPREPSGAPRTSGVKIACLARLDPTKGVDLLIEAVRSLPNAALELDVYGIAQSEADGKYLSRLKSLAAGDRRIAFLPPVAAGQVVPLLRKYDAVAVPSLTLETGPLVVLEAFAAGVPVLGSNLGGIAELVVHEVNGLLVRPNSPEAWREALERLAWEQGLLDRLRAGVRPARPMATVAGEMLDLYQRIISRDGAPVRVVENVPV